MVTIVGLDLSLTSTGYACGEHRAALTSKHSGAERLADLRDQVLGLVRAQTYPLVILEGYSYASKSQAHSTGELGGVIRCALFDHGIAYVVAPPTNRAKFATGRGGASKSEVVSAVSARTGIVWSGKGADDMCDAFVLEEMALTHLGRGRYEWPAKNREALDGIEWQPLDDFVSLLGALPDRD